MLQNPSNLQTPWSPPTCWPCSSQCPSFFAVLPVTQKVCAFCTLQWGVASAGAQGSYRSAGAKQRDKIWYLWGAPQWKLCLPVKLVKTVELHVKSWQRCTNLKILSAKEGCNPVSQAGSFSSPSKCDIATKQKASSERLSSVLSQDLQCSFSHTLVIISKPLVENTHLWNYADFSCFWDYSVEVRALSESWHSVSELQALTTAPGLNFGWEISLGAQTL